MPGRVLSLSLPAGTIYNCVGLYQSGPEMASNIAMKAGVHCKYESVPDEVAIEAFAALGLQPWIAEGNVEMLKWFREGKCVLATGPLSPRALGPPHANRPPIARRHLAPASGALHPLSLPEPKTPFFPFLKNVADDDVASLSLSLSLVRWRSGQDVPCDIAAVTGQQAADFRAFVKGYLKDLLVD